MMIVRPVLTQLFVPRRDHGQRPNYGAQARPQTEQVEILEAAPIRGTQLHPESAMMAHLMATQLDAPQTRRLRRVENEEGAAAYRSTREEIACARRGAVPLPSWTA